MLRVIGQQSDGTAAGGLNRKDRQARINGARGAGDIGALVAGMHVGANGGITEWVFENFIRAANPTAVERLLPVINGGPANARGREILIGADDGLGDAGDQEGGVV